MPSTVLPQTTLASDFSTFLAGVSDNVRPLLMGGHAGLHRYSNATEQPTIDIGAYDDSIATVYDYPGQATGSIIDESFVKLWIKDGLLQYYHHSVSDSPALAPVSGYQNRIRSAGTAFADHGTAYPHDAMFLDRGVMVGDVIDVAATVSAVPYFKRTTVVGFIGEPVAAVTGSATADAANHANTTLLASSTQTAGCTNHVDGTTTKSAAAYNGISTGDLSETYTVTVIQAPTVPGDATTALLSVVSASGNDNVASFAPSAYGAATPIGVRGATITFAINGAFPVTCVSTDDFVIGQEWTFNVREVYTSGTAVSAGTYVGTQDTVYIIECVLGGRFADSIKPQIKITTATGIDASGPTTVTSNAVAVNAGTLGVTITFGSYTGLVFGDKWTIAVTAATTGDYQTILLADNLPTGILPATDLDVILYIKKSFQVPIERVSAPGVFNYTVTATDVTVEDSIDAYDSTWTNSGTQEPLPVVEGTLFLEYREWLDDVASLIVGVITNDDIEAECGPIDPDNPLGWAAAKAVLNANGSIVYVCGITDPTDVASFELGLAAITDIATLYNLVPLSSDPAVGALFKAHVDAESDPALASYRAAWFNLTAHPTVVLISEANTSDLNPALGTTSTMVGDPGGTFRLLTCTTGNAKFVTNEVRPGDTVRYQYTTDAWGNVTYSTYDVDYVINEDELHLVGGTGTAIGTPAMFEIWRNNTNTEISDDLIAQRATYNDSRVVCVWPDEADSLPGYYLCAALAGEASGILPNQGMRNTQLLGFTDLTKAITVNLARLVANGIWVVTQDIFGITYSKSAVTSYVASGSTLLQTEEMVRRNKDTIDLYVLSSVAPLIGSSNVTPDTVINVESLISVALNTLRSFGITTRLGAALIDFVIVDVHQDVILRDKIVVTLEYTLPAPLNVVTVTSTIII